MCEYERVRWTVLFNELDGRYEVVDVFKSRVEKLRSRIRAWAEITERYREDNPDTRLVMVTLTYARGEDYEAGNIRDYIKKIKRKLGKKLLAWAWVAEVQSRGAVHYHVTVMMPKGTKFPMPDKSGMWKFGMSKVQTARSPWYLVKYVGKEHQKDLARYPKGCRLYATSIRFGGEDIKDLYREMAGLKEVNGKSGEWMYVGSSITERYARGILVGSKRV